MECFTEVTSTEAFTQALMEVMEAFAEDMKAFTEVTSTEAFMEAFTAITTTKAFMEALMKVMQAFVEVMEASMEDMEDLRASTEKNFTGTSTNSSTKASMQVLPRKLPWELSCK